MRERFLIAVKAILDALRHYLFTILLAPVIGLLAYKKMEGVGLFVAGVFAGYLQGFFEECVKNYKLRAAVETKKVKPVETHTTRIQLDRAQAKRRRDSWLPSLQKVALIILKGALRAVVILLVGVLLWNLFLFIIYR
jgi:hypothetical protein